MPSKRRLDQLKSARAAAVQACKKRKSEASSVLNTVHEVEDDELSISDTSDTEGGSGTWFWNESANGSDSDTEEDGDNDEDENEEERDQEEGESKTQEAVSLGVPKLEIKWNKQGEDKLRGGYGNGSRTTLKKKRKFARELEKEASNTYDIRALWKRGSDLGLISSANSQERLGQLPELQPNNGVSSPLSEIPRGGTSLLSKKDIHKSQQIKALNDLNRLLKLVTEQEKKYGTRLSPHSNYYRRHVMVQQFLQSQLNSQPSPTRRTLSLNVARAFRRSGLTARLIVQWEKSWVELREIPERKEREDSYSWMYDGDLNDAMRAFVRTQGDRLSSYKLVQFLKTYVNPQGIETPITIRSRTARTWLLEDRTNFLKRMEELKPYMVEFNEDGTMKPKAYPPNCAVEGENRRPIIVITHDECTFSANDGVRKAWTREGDTFLRPKGRGQGIMVSEFFLPFGRLNLSSLSSEKRQEVIEKAGLTHTEAVEIFEYGKNNDRYWDGAKLHQQVVNNALPIAEALYPGYSLLFLFGNATSHSVYAKDALQVKDMNKGVGGQQPRLRNGWFYHHGIRVDQPMDFQEDNGELTPKGIQKILEERNLWPIRDLKLECVKPKVL